MENKTGNWKKKKRKKEPRTLKYINAAVLAAPKAEARDSSAQKYGISLGKMTS